MKKRVIDECLAKKIKHKAGEKPGPQLDDARRLRDKKYPDALILEVSRINKKRVHILDILDSPQT